jgi:hypothetical protein
MSTPVVDYDLDASEVQVGTPNGPGLLVAEVGTDPPDDTTDEWPDGWNVLGYLSDDGPTVGQSTESESMTPWQSVAPIRDVITSRSVTAQFVLWQINALTLALYFDTDLPTVDADGSIDMEVRTDQAGHVYALGIDSRDGERALRVIFPRASLSDAGDMPINRGAAVPLDCTLSALETDGVLCLVKLGPATSGASIRRTGDKDVRGKTNGHGNGGGSGGGSGQRAARRRAPGVPAGGVLLTDSPAS